ncbi:MAG: response regulator, partial [Rhodothermales bacterium]|nr:response regulator [Rhodothermales bacterium]
VPSQTLLVVDDSRDIRDYVVSCLQSYYNIVTAKDGLDGLGKLKDVQPDLIISDVMMPRMDGYAFCRAVKKDPDFKHIPVILLTSKASLEAKLEGLEAGSDDYLAKPFNATELRVRIRNLLRLRHQASELKGLNDELVETNGALREASELKSQLLNIASHDMKNPLTAIREFARIIRDEVGEDSHLDELLELIYSSSNEMLQLVTQLLDSAALESGQLVLNRRPVSVSSLAEIVVHRNSNQAKLKGQEITTLIDGDPDGMVSADFDRLQEAMDNLISNAIKYSPLEKPIEVAVRSTKESVRFEVKDYGPGISEEDMQKLFGKFVKLSAQPTGGESSTGLGLSIVKQIVEMHDGQVLVDSELGEGSTFIIELTALTEDEVGEDVPLLG